MNQPNKRARTIKNIRELLHAGESKEALKLFQGVPQQFRKDPELLFLKALTYERLRNPKQAILHAKEAIKQREHIDVLLLLARCLHNSGETDQCLQTLDRVDALRPGNENNKIMRAAALESAGRFDEATSVLEPIVRSYTETEKAMPNHLRVEWSKLLVQNKRYDEAVPFIDTTLETLKTAATQSHQHYLKAKALDRQKNYDQAAEAARQANEIGKIDYAPKLHTLQVEKLIENWSRENMASFPKSACDSVVPVFVAGMPRSGTSLIDQIIDAHPKAAGVGELNTIEQFAVKLSSAYDPEKPSSKQFGSLDSFRWTRAANDYVKQITALASPGAERIVNKSLGNNKLVGLLARLFPQTRIIHAIRDPRDVAISCYMGGFNNNMHAWTTQIDWVSHVWSLSMQMIDHWKASLDIPVLDVHYEKLVANPEEEFPRIIEFLGLEWDEQCFEFHKSRRTVRTLSYDQVNRPLYSSSSGRHANYPGLIEGVDFPDYDAILNQSG